MTERHQGVGGFVQPVRTGDIAVFIIIRETEPDRDFDIFVLSDILEHRPDPFRFIASDAAAGKLGDDPWKRAEIFPIVLLDFIVNLRKTAPFLQPAGMIIGSGIVAGDTDQIDIFIARIIVQRAVPVIRRSIAVVRVIDPDTVIYALLLENLINRSPVLHEDIRIRHIDNTTVTGPVTVHLVA